MLVKIDIILMIEITIYYFIKIYNLEL